jgi:hypothetical protein
MKKLSFTTVLYATPRRILVSLAVLLTASVAYADLITVTGDNVALLPATTVYGPSTGPTQTSPGTLGQFNPTLGVLTGAVATAAFVPGPTPPGPARLIVGGGTGSATARSTWSLGGNGPLQTVINTANNTGQNGWSPINVTSSAGNLNNFVGGGNIATNSFASYISVQHSSGGTTYAHPGTSLTAKQILYYNESIAYTYSTHSNASFESAGDDNDLTLDFGELAFGTNDDESFSIFNLGGLGLTNFTLNFLSGDNLFNITGGNVAAGGSSLYNASFAGQNPLALTDYEGIYRLTFTDNVSGLAQYAAGSVGTNYIDLTMQASVAPVSIPEPSMLIALGMGVVALAFYKWRQR